MATKQSTKYERLEGLSQRRGVDTQHAQQAERDRRLRWAQEMIMQNPALCAEVYCAMSKRPAMPPRRESSLSSSSSSSRRSPSTAAGSMPSPGISSNSSINSGSPT
ncbi:uncharacterized protein BKCO1_1500050 [Diplodia corticola]|uniref:Uncharacterized protein n=1 Tax=Diplodia corticola TaxID=236234 RepID=A0A1J9R5M3_9PEZI|nr:uncharacterized protein BKCO1_1500050 [Diplodia corticola]OJD35857.1 hypothetical protein BKCO1_1500050 [Diplodia corticola]